MVNNEHDQNSFMDILRKMEPLYTLSGLLVTSASILLLVEETIGTLHQVPIFLLSSGLTTLFGSIIMSLYLYIEKIELIEYYLKYFRISLVLFFGTSIIFLILALIELFNTPYGLILSHYFHVIMGFYMGIIGYMSDRLKWKDDAIGLNPLILILVFIIAFNFYVNNNLTIKYLYSAKPFEKMIMVASMLYLALPFIEMIILMYKNKIQART